MPNRFCFIETVHNAEVTWWWTEEKLHDSDYKLAVADSVNAKVLQLERKYGVRDDTTYRCQWEGCLLTGDNLANVVAAGNELARHVARFKGIVAVDL